MQPCTEHRVAHPHCQFYQAMTTRGRRARWFQKVAAEQQINVEAQNDITRERQRVVEQDDGDHLLLGDPELGHGPYGSGAVLADRGRVVGQDHGGDGDEEPKGAARGDAYQQPSVDRTGDITVDKGL